MRLPTASLPGAALLAACGVVLAAAGLIALGGGPVPHVRVSVTIPPDGRLPSGEIGSLFVALNTSGAAIEPRFFIVEGPAVYEWKADSSHLSYGSGPITYRIVAPCSGCAIPSGTLFLVRVYDVLSGTYSFSPTLSA